MIRKIFSLLFLLSTLAGCMSGTAAADVYSPSIEEFMHGLYAGERELTEERAELREKSVYFREEMSDISLKERLVTLIEVYKDERVIEYFTEARENDICSGFGVNNLGYFSILVYSFATDEEIEELIAGFDNLSQSYDTLPVCVQVSDGVTSTVLITLRDYMQTPDLTLLVTRPVYEGEIPAAFAQYEETIRESIYPAYIILLTACSFSLCFLFSRRKSPENDEDSTPAKILAYLGRNLPSSEQAITKKLGASRGSVRYQLRRLEAEGKIFKTTIGGRAFYAIQKIPTDKISHAIFLAHDNEIEWRICGFLLEHGDNSRFEIAENLKVSPAVVYYHLNRMETILQKEKLGGGDWYRLRDEVREWFFVNQVELPRS